MELNIDNKSQRRSIIFVLFFLCIFALGVIGYVYKKNGTSIVSIIKNLPNSQKKDAEIEFRKFSSKQEFSDYLNKSQQLQPSYSTTDMPSALPDRSTQEQEPVAETGDIKVNQDSLSFKLPSAQSRSLPQFIYRVSETNIQVEGIDEPDIVKTDGENIYVSNENEQVYYPLEIDLRGNSFDYPPPSRLQSYTHLIQANPPANLSELTKIDKTGDLLLYRDNLVILTKNNVLYGYDISTRSTALEKWSVDLGSNTTFIAARLYKGNIYLVTRTNIDYYNPCPIIPYKIRGSDVSIACEDIYRPIIPVSVDTTYTISQINPASGEINKKMTFTGSSGSSVVYMSPNALYTTFQYFKNDSDIMLDFYITEGRDLFPYTVINHLEKVVSYDISNNAKQVEIAQIIASYTRTLSSDERLQFENESRNKMQKYQEKYIRSFNRTGIVKVDVYNFNVIASTSVPGNLLNQFSLDEHNNNLRVATTIPASQFTRDNQQTNDIYVLGNNLQQKGSVLDIGKTERIYSVRFIADRGYVVTFKQIDPFFIFDLSNPDNPIKTGELKIPGYSSYLHPLKEHLILGVGKEDREVKLTLFDVSDSSNPRQYDTYILNETWSEALETHHAFLADSSHEVVFIPGSKGGYVFSYKDNRLSLIKTISEQQVKRAVYINDYLYIIGENSIVVYNENNWQEVNRINY